MFLSIEIQKFLIDLPINFKQREIFKYIVFELRTFVLQNRVSTFWYQCPQY